jgi:hypothetical protein
LLELYQHAIGDACVNAALKSLAVGDEEIVSNKLNTAPEPIQPLARKNSSALSGVS